MYIILHALNSFKTSHSLPTGLILFNCTILPNIYIHFYSTNYRQYNFVKFRVNDCEKVPVPVFHCSHDDS